MPVEGVTPSDTNGISGFSKTFAVEGRKSRGACQLVVPTPPIKC